MSRRLVAGVIFDKVGNVLLEANIKHNSFRITPIGGKVEEDKNEDPIDALKRECWEEYRLWVQPKDIIGTYGTTSKGEGAFSALMVHCEITKITPGCWKDGKPIPQEPEKSAYADWFSLDELNRLNAHKLLAPNLSLFIEVLQDNFRQFALRNMHAEIPKSMTLFQLFTYFKRQMDLCLRNYHEYRRKSSRDPFHLPDDFLMIHETPELARSYFELCRAVSG